MPTFQFLLCTSGVYVEFDGDTKPAVGFYTSRRACGATSEQAFQRAMSAFDTDRKMADIFQAAHDAGLRPKTEIEKVYLVPWWKAIWPWKQPGLLFYPADDDDHRDGSSLTTGQQANS